MWSPDSGSTGSFPFFFQKVGLSWFNSIFFVRVKLHQKTWHDFFSKFGLSRLNSFFLKNRVELVQLD